MTDTCLAWVSSQSPPACTGWRIGGTVSKIPRALSEGVMPTRLVFTVPLVPPSVNHYAQHTTTGRHYKTKKSISFKEAVAIYAQHQYVVARSFSVRINIVLGVGEKGDIDNFPKLVLDGLAAAGVFRDKKAKWLSDAHVSHMIVDVDRGTRPERGFTAITVEALR